MMTEARERALGKVERGEDREAIRKVVLTMEAKGISQKRVKDCVDILRRWSGAGPTPLAQRTPEEAISWLNSLEAAPRSVNLYRDYLGYYYQAEWIAKTSVGTFVSE
jgi:hypothetical protein